MVPAAVGAELTAMEPAAAAPVGSASGSPHTGFAQLLAKNVRNMQASCEPLPNIASACACDAQGVGTSGAAEPVALMIPTSKERPSVAGRPAMLGSNSTQ